MAIATAHRHSALRDVGLLLARLVIGAIFIVHGAQKVFQLGLPAVQQNFAGMHVPFPEITAPLVAFVELIGGILLVLGLLTPIAGVALAIDMLGAAIIVHLANGMFAENGGWETVAGLGAGALALAASGPGRFALDHLLYGRFRERRMERRRADELNTAVEAERARNQRKANATTAREDARREDTHRDDVRRDDARIDDARTEETRRERFVREDDARGTDRRDDVRTEDVRHKEIRRDDLDRDDLGRDDLARDRTDETRTERTLGERDQSIDERRDASLAADADTAENATGFGEAHRRDLRGDDTTRS